MGREARFQRLDPAVRKARFVDATLACLQKHGFQGTSIRRICAEAGVSIGLLNHHYTGKDELVADAYREVTERMHALMRAAVEASAPGARARLGAYFGASFSPEVLNPRLLDAYLAFWGAVKSAEAIGRAHEESYAGYNATLSGLLEELAREQGWERFDVRLAAISLSALLDGLWLEYGLDERSFSPAQGVQMCEAWIDGLLAGAWRRFVAPA
jgi:AcrR family transcriptional regulator